MADNRTMAQLLEAPTEGYEDAIVVPEITANNFELKHGLLILIQNKQFFGHDKEDRHAHIRYYNKITSTMKFLNVPSTPVKLMLLPFSLEGAARIGIEKEPPRSILTWDDLELHQLDTFYNALNSNDQDSLNSAAGGNFLDKIPRDCQRIIKRKSKVHNSRNKPVVAKVILSSSTLGISPDVAELKDMVKALILDKKNQSQAPAPVKAVEESCVTCVVLILTKIVPPPMATFIVTIFKSTSLKPSQLILIKEIPVIEARLLIKFDLPVFLLFNKTKEITKTVTTKTGGLITTKAKFIDPRFTKLHLTKLWLRKHKVELTLRVGKEAVTFNLDQTSRYSSNYDDNSVNRIDVIEMACEEYSQEVLGFL
ncbi:hypothetical protein Tco_0375607 [Tanacetum coccineum]